MRPRGAAPLVPATARDVPPLADDLDVATLRTAVARMAKLHDSVRTVAARRLLEIVETVPDPTARRDAVLAAFRVVRVRDPLLLTAYYEPELAGSLTRTATYRYPLYARPKDLVDVEPARLDAGCSCRRMAARVHGGRLEPYPSRAEIDGGALAGRGLEIAWAADPVQLAVLHVQGSGRLRLDDGHVVGVRYAGTNGRPYRSLGQTLVQHGLLHGGVTLPAIRRALAALTPGERAAMLAANERYTFFRLAKGGATGSLGVELTPGRSVATDPRLVPPGALAYVATAETRRFVVSQDTGAAITGAHADLFLGAGADAEERAGRTKEHGTMLVLLPR